jgi:hypothetical protein
MKHKTTNTPAIPFHPLIDEQPVDTLSHIQTMLRFAQESATKATVDTELTPHQIRVLNRPDFPRRSASSKNSLVHNPLVTGHRYFHAASSNYRIAQYS